MNKIARADIALAIFYLRGVYMKLVSFRTLRSMCLDLIIFLIPLSLIFLAFPYVISVFAPFIVGGILYLTANPLNKFFLKNKLPKSLCAFLSLGIISLGVFFFLRIIGGKILQELSSFASSPPRIYTDAINDFSEKISHFIKKSGFGGTAFFDSLASGASSALSDLFSNTVASVSNFLINFAKSIPSILIASFAAVFTTFFLLREGDSFFPLLRKFFGEKTCDGFMKFKKTFVGVAASYIKAQLIIEGIIFLVLLIGFYILKVNYSFILALFTAIVDAVPVLGTGTVLLPIAVFNFFTGKSALGWGLLLLYGVTLLTRQLCEPKILGKSLGIHPLLTVFSLYAGMKLFGILGLIFGPFFAIFLKFLIFPE